MSAATGFKKRSARTTSYSNNEFDAAPDRNAIVAAAEATVALVRASRLSQGEAALANFDAALQSPAHQLAIWVQLVARQAHVAAELIPAGPVEMFEEGSALIRVESLRLEPGAFRYGETDPARFIPDLLMISAVIPQILVGMFRRYLIYTRSPRFDRVEAIFESGLYSAAALLLVSHTTAIAELGMLNVREAVDPFDMPAERRLLRASGPHRLEDQHGAHLIDRRKLN